jgi:alpha/beta superfamily hydrolase
MSGRAVVASGVIALAVAASGSAAPPKTVAAYCKDPSAKGDIVRFAGITGAVVGSGKVGILLSNTSDGHICDWVLNDFRLMDGFAKRGYRVLLYEYRGKTEAAQARDTATAAAELRKLGSTTIVLGGASIGGTTSLEIAGSLKPAPAGVFGFSAGSDTPAAVKAAASKLKLPVLLVAATSDLNTPTTKAIYRAVASKDKQLILVPGQTHGFFDLDPASAKVDAAVFSFIEKHT